MLSTSAFAERFEIDILRHIILTTVKAREFAISPSTSLLLGSAVLVLHGRTGWLSVARRRSRAPRSTRRRGHMAVENEGFGYRNIV
jgi:hypothetical protein